MGIKEAGNDPGQRARVNRDEQRVIGVVVFFALNYSGSFGGPVVSGWLAELAGDVTAAFQFGAVCLIASVRCLATYRRLAARPVSRKHLTP